MFACIAATPLEIIAQPILLEARAVRTITGGDDPLFRVSGAVALNDGRVLVAERNDHRIRVFDREGRELPALAESGSGPRDVRSPCCLVTTEDDYLVITDNGNARFLVMSLRDTSDSASIVRQLVPHGSAEMLPYVRGNAFSDGSWRLYDRAAPFLGVWQLRWINTRGMVSANEETRVPTWDSTTKHVISYETEGGTGATTVFPPFGRRTLRHVSADGRVAEANSDLYVITISDRTGRIILRIDRSSERGVALTRVEADSAAQRLLATATRTRTDLTRLKVRIPSHKPLIRAMRFDDAGNLWVERYVKAGDLAFVEVYDRAGVLSHTVRWPASVDIFLFRLSLEQLMGLRSTDEGEEVVVLELSRAPHP
ncbi:MAG: hypothetical protein ACYC0B_05210 [Gemmatimonadaceae bacterium]